MKLAVIGSRSINKPALINHILTTINKNIGIDVIVSGGALGIDSLAESWARIFNIPVEIYYPDYEKYGKAAAFIRNNLIAENCEYMLAIWDGVSKGTMHCYKTAQKLGKKCKLINLGDNNAK